MAERIRCLVSFKPAARAARHRIARCLTRPHIWRSDRALRMKPHEDEFKVMGMAPYAHASACDGLYDRLRSLLWVERDASGAPAIASARGTRLAHRFIGDFVRDFRFDIQCGAMQRLCEDTILEWMSAWIRHLGLDHDGVAIGLGGGVLYERQGEHARSPATLGPNGHANSRLRRRVVRRWCSIPRVSGRLCGPGASARNTADRRYLSRPRLGRH